TDFHINSFGGPLTVYIDDIKQVQTHEYREPVAPSPTPEAEEITAEEVTAEALSEEESPSEEAPAEAVTTEEVTTEEVTTEEVTTEAVPSVEEEAVYPETDRPLGNSFLVDDFNRASLMLDPEMEIAPGGQFGGVNTDGNIIYWIQFNEDTKPVIEDGVLRLEATGSGWYGTATDPAYLDEYNCVAFRIKGAEGGEEELLTFNPDTLGSKTFAELIGPDGNPVPGITTDWQTVVIDLVKSGWIGLADGKEFYQNMHLNTNGPVTVFIDEIYFTAVNLEESLATAAAPTEAPTSATTEAATAAPVPAEAPAATFNTARLLLIILLSFVVVGAVTGAVVLLAKKTN
ncbi:MAG: hypothetical protein LBR83_02740, partial [Clostridiales bacterium]|nr:hypothetical protein [Clostridiales bacterium]